MAEKEKQIVNCIHCGAEVLVEQNWSCPSCGENGKLFKKKLEGEFPSPHSSLGWESRKEYYQKHKEALTIVVAITILSPFLGLVLAGPVGVIAGLILGIISYFLGPNASTKIIEKTRGHA